jgi:hypothetical protein
MLALTCYTTAQRRSNLIVVSNNLTATAQEAVDDTDGQPLTIMWSAPFFVLDLLLHMMWDLLGFKKKLL